MGKTVTKTSYLIVCLINMEVWNYSDGKNIYINGYWLIKYITDKR